MRTLLFSLLTWLWACAGLFAQNTAPLSRQAAKTDCQNRLEQAENAIQRGEIFFALAKIEDCALHARERFSPEDGLRALRLLIILYEETRQTEKAEKAMQMLLHQYPRFKPASSVDRYQLIYAWEKFKVSPNIQVFAIGAGGIPRIHSTATWQATQGFSSQVEADSLSSFLISTSGWSLPAGFDTLKLANSSIQSKSYRPILGATYGAGMTIKAYRTVSAEIVGAVDIYSWKTIPNKFYYAYYSFLPGISSYSENVNKDIWTYAMSQQARYLRFSGGLRWELLNWYHPVRPYVEGGVSVQKLLSVSRNMQKFTYSSGVFQVADGADPVKGETIVTSPVGAFESTLAGWYGGIGLSLGRKDFSCAVGLRAGGMVGNIVDPLHRYEDQAALFEYFHVEDDLSLTWLSFQTTVAYTLRYAVKKRHNFASITKE